MRDYPSTANLIYDSIEAVLQFSLSCLSSFKSIARDTWLGENVGF